LKREAFFTKTKKQMAIYEASAVATGKESGRYGFVYARSETSPQKAVDNARNQAHMELNLFPFEEAKLEDVEVFEIDKSGKQLREISGPPWPKETFTCVRETYS
jgi:hypothetical protein